MVHLHDAGHSFHFWISLVAIQRETMVRGGESRGTRAEAVDGEATIGIVKLEHVTDGENRGFVGIQAALSVEGWIEVVEGIGE